jgi:hypothetical protein
MDVVQVPFVKDIRMSRKPLSRMSEDALIFFRVIWDSPDITTGAISSRVRRNHRLDTAFEKMKRREMGDRPILIGSVAGQVVLWT